MPTPVTPEAARMAEVVAACAPLLKAAGFRKRRHSFNRSTPAGLVHVVNFWQAPKEPPAWTELTGLRERLYGTFRVDFGVRVPEMTRMGTPNSGWVNEYNCDLRCTIGELMATENLDQLQEAEDLWRPLDDPDNESWAKTAVIQYGIPWLDRFPDHDAVIAKFADHGPLAIGMSPAGALDIADMLVGLDRGTEARQVLEHYLSEPILRNHASYLAEYLSEIGHSDLVRSIQMRDT